MSSPLNAHVPLVPPPNGSSAAAWQSFLDAPTPSQGIIPKSHKQQRQKQQHQHQQQQRQRKLSSSASSHTAATFPFLKLPIEVQVHVLAFLAPEELHACLTLNKDTFQLITDPWPWKAAFLRLFHALPLLALGTCWRTEYTKRTYTWRKLVGNVVNTYTGTRLSNISQVLPSQNNLLTVLDKSFGVAIRLQLSNGRQTQVGRYSIHGGNGAADINESCIALCKSSRIQLLLFGNPSHNTQIYRQMDLATSDSPLHVAWVSSLQRPLPSALVVAYPGTRIEVIHVLNNNSFPGSSAAPSSSSPESLVSDPVARHTLPPLVVTDPLPPTPHHAQLTQPAVEQEQVTHIKASSSTIVALTATSSTTTLFSLALPAAQEGLRASSPPCTLSLPCSTYGVITDLVYSAETHPLALLATSKLDSAPLLAVRVDAPSGPALVAQIPHVCSAAHMTPSSNSQAPPDDPDRVTAWAWTAGHPPAFALDRPPVGAGAGSLPTVVVVTGDSHGILRIYSLGPSSATASYTLTHTSTLSGHRFPITALHINATLLVSAATTGWVRIWDVAAGECVKRIQAYTRKQADRESVTHVCAWTSGARDRVAVVFASGMVKVLESRKGSGGRRSRKVSGGGANGQGAGAQMGQGSGGGGLGKGGTNGALGRGQSPTALQAEIQRELRDHRQSSHERQRLEHFATRLNGNVDLTEDEMIQLAMLLSSEQPTAARPNPTGTSLSSAAGEWEHVPPELLHATQEEDGHDWTADLSEEEALRIALEQSLLEQ